MKSYDSYLKLAWLLRAPLSLGVRRAIFFILCKIVADVPETPETPLSLGAHNFQIVVAEYLELSKTPLSFGAHNFHIV